MAAGCHWDNDDQLHPLVEFSKREKWEGNWALDSAAGQDIVSAAQNVFVAQLEVVVSSCCCQNRWKVGL